MAMKMIIVDTPHGQCYVRESHYKNGTTPTILSAINKNEYFISKANMVHSNKYSYSNVLYNSCEEKIPITCGIHGDFYQTPGSHLNGNGCPLCSVKNRSENKKLSINEFILKANIIHKFKYNYSYVNYTKTTEPVDIECPIHGMFSQKPMNHIAGKGCRLCANDLISKSMSMNPTGWSKSKWVNAAKLSKNFESFKCYVIRCYGNDEEFIKIGRTFRTVSDRFT